ncbi:MAG: DUF192 domain-containing protein [Ignavibacteria bacterium]|nr:DUF192 domain-containing protein [Ignavibacteria bacterium]MBT8381588.1 DUF192 domain-containing protein [Ignavibacteria bacterium]MBT8391979.1 DUF192 domain-containing protein [Ignavibacteria bacterium]NNJ53161.1 DUF192 domain-containing protein [Ignavibacteriaceae bacterium]NNL21040.1 DUF192 domain-containing protein [Ignavibacteriaceae bacterium]
MAQKKRKKKQKETQLQKKRFKPLIVKIGIATLFIVIAAFFIFNNCDDDPNDVNYYTFKKEGELTFTDSSANSIVKIDIEIADSDYERQLGLMNRESMEELQGMLFIFPAERYQSFWMLNTLFSLDMLFINSKNEIVTIHKNTTPLSQQGYPSSMPAKFVLEVIAGFTDKYNINEGDKVFWIGTKINI